MAALQSPVAAPSSTSSNSSSFESHSSSSSPSSSSPSKQAGRRARDTCLLSLVVGKSAAAPIYRALDSPAYLCFATAVAAVAIVVGTVAATTSVNQAHDKHARLCAVSVLVLPLYLQRLATLDGRCLHALLGHFECVFVLANWLVVFPCLGRVIGLGPGSWRLLYFTLMHLASSLALLTDAARDEDEDEDEGRTDGQGQWQWQSPAPHAFRGIVTVAATLAVYAAWVVAFTHESVPKAFYDKPLLLREDRLAEAMGPARDVLTTRLFTLILFLLKDLVCLVMWPSNFVVLTQPMPRKWQAQQQAAVVEQVVDSPSGPLVTTEGAKGGRGSSAPVKPI